MRKFFKKLTIAMAFICVLSFVGCKKKGDEPSGSDSGSATECTVRFVQAGYDDVVKKVDVGESLAEVPSPQIVTGYTVVWDHVDFQNISQNLTVTAIATANSYTVTYDANGGTVDGDTEELIYDSSYTLKTPTKDNFEFVGWKNGTETVASSGTWNIAKDVTLVAEWEEKEAYTITYNLGSNAQAGLIFSTQTVFYGEDFTLVIPSNTNSALYFVCWVITDTTTVFEDGNWTLKEDISLTAVWDTVFSGQH